MSNAYYPPQDYNAPPPAYGQPVFQGPYQQQGPPVMMQPQAQPQVVYVEERRNNGCGQGECCCFALFAFCCGICCADGC